MTDVRTALRWGTWTIAAVSLLLYRSPALEAAGRFGHPQLQRAVYLGCVGAWIATAGLLVRPPRPAAASPVRRAATALLLLAVLAGTVAVTLALPSDQQPTSTSWAVAANGWLLLAIATGSRTSTLLLLLVLPHLPALAVTALSGTRDTVPMTARTLGVLGLQVPVAMASYGLERAAQMASALRRGREAMETSQAVASALDADRLRRSRQVFDVVGPVLAELAALGPVQAPGDELRRRCGVAGAQVRRLLSEWHRGGPDPVDGDLASCLDHLQAAGLRVDLAVRGRRARMPAALAAAGCDVVLRLAGHAGERMRVTLVVGPVLARLAVVIDRAASAQGPDPAPPDVPAPVTIAVTGTNDTLWVELTCPV